MNSIKKIGLAGLLGTFLLASQAQAGRINDPNYSHSRLQERNVCESVENCRSIGIFLNPNSNEGIQANYHSDEELVKTISRLYVPKEMLKRELRNNPLEPKEDGIVYLLTADTNIFKTIGLFSSLHLNRDLRVYSTIKEAQKDVKSYIQALDIINNKNAGVYDKKGQLITN